jgi:hypothetical protein
VPYSEKITVTLEDLSINDPEQQARRFGQRDHVRIYFLKNYIERLERSGFYIQLLSPEQLLQYRKYAIQEKESVIIAYKSADAIAQYNDLQKHL